MIRPQKIAEVVTYAAVGGVCGFVSSEALGTMGLAGRAVAIAIGKPPMVAAGAVVGVAVYSLKESLR